MVQDTNKRNKLITIGIILFEIILFCVATMVVTPFYETDDDNTMAAISLGAYGERSHYLVFSHSILGRIIIFLTELLPITNWYTILQWAVLFCSFTVILNVLLKNTSIVRSIFVALLLGITFNFQFYYSLQFTKTAATATLAGILLLVDTLKHGKQTWKLILGAGLLLVGSMYRFEGYGMTLCMAFFWVLIIFVRHIKAKEWDAVKKYLFCFGVPIVLSVGLYISDLAMYQRDDAWREYSTYNALRSELLDFGFPEMEDNAELYESLDIGEIEYMNYGFWDFADAEKFTIETMTRLVEAKETNIYIANIQKFFSETYLAVKKLPFIPLILVGILYFLLFRKQKFVEFLAIAIGIIGVEAYFICLGRAQLEYTNAAMILTMLVLICYSSKEKEFLLDKKILKYLLCFAGCVFVLNIWYKTFMYGIEKRYARNENEDRDEVTALICNDKENFYLSKVGHGVRTFTNIWEPVSEGQRNNTSTLGDWLTMSPIVLEQLDKYGISNPYRALAEMDNVYLADSFSAKWKHEYILRNYNEDAKMVRLKNLGGYQIWKFVDEELVLETENYTDINENFYYHGSVTNGASGLHLEGYLYEEATNSYHQKMYLGVAKEGMEEEFYYVEQRRNTESNDVYNGKYAGFYVYYEGTIDFEKDIVNLYLENETGLYQIEFVESM